LGRVHHLRGDGQLKRSRFAEEQIIGVLRDQEAGIKVAEVCRQHGISELTFDAWKAKFGRMIIPDAKRLKQLGEDNTKSKKLLAEAIIGQRCAEGHHAKKVGAARRSKGCCDCCA
jgi:putative transposase